MQKTDVRWVNHLLVAAALLAFIATFAVLLLGREKSEHRHDAMIADITINLGGRPVREHCTTCHPGGGRPHTEERHPEIAPHSPEKLGCTSCHLGEGMALDTMISHGLSGLGARTVLKGKELQASCYTCHELQPLPGAEQAWKGYLLFLEKACETCHRIDGLDSSGRYGPDLSATGSHLGLEKIEEAIREPKREPENSIMPRFPLSRGQAAQIGYFLKSRVRNPFHSTPMEIQAGRLALPSPAIDDRADPVHKHRCLACHKYGEEDGRIAPDLTYIGTLRPGSYLERFLTAPARLIPGAIMPDILMPPADKVRLLSFLQSEAVGPIPPDEVPSEKGIGHAGHGPSDQAAKHFYMLLCQRCHAAAGDGFGLIQPNLANFPRAFAGNAGFFRSIGDDRIVRSLTEGVPGTSMPPFGRLLDEQSRDRVIDLIFSSFVGIDRRDKLAQQPLPSRPAELTSGFAESIFRKECSVCHGIAGTGTGPEHLRYLPRPRNLTNHAYFAQLPDERIARAIYSGVPGTAMKPFGDELSAEGIWSLVDKVRLLSGGAQ